MYFYFKALKNDPSPETISLWLLAMKKKLDL
jgi:hypothetical protein